MKVKWEVNDFFAPLLEDLVTLGVEIDPAVDRALIAGADVLVEGMQEAAPEKTGHLKDSIKRGEPVRDGNLHYIEVGLVGADADTSRYGNAQEYGTSSMQAQPYVRPTIDGKMGKARKKMGESLKADGMV